MWWVMKRLTCPECKFGFLLVLTKQEEHWSKTYEEGVAVKDGILETRLTLRCPLCDTNYLLVLGEYE
jgi:uncharacterized protein YbaR (Trm112 family)